MQTLTVITPPATEALTTSEAKAHLRVDISDDDTYIGNLITVARERLESYSNRTLVTTVYELVMDGFPCGVGYLNREIRQLGPDSPLYFTQWAPEIVLDRPPLASITSITYLDTNGVSTVLASTEYESQAGSPGTVRPAYGKVWPSILPRYGALKVRYSAGYGVASAVPKSLKQAMLLDLGTFYEHRKTVTDASLSPLPIGYDALVNATDWGWYG